MEVCQSVKEGYCHFTGYIHCASVERESHNPCLSLFSIIRQYNICCKADAILVIFSLGAYFIYPSLPPSHILVCFNASAPRSLFCSCGTRERLNTRYVNPETLQDGPTIRDALVPGPLVTHTHTTQGTPHRYTHILFWGYHKAVCVGGLRQSIVYV